MSRYDRDAYVAHTLRECDRATCPWCEPKEGDE